MNDDTDLNKNSTTDLQKIYGCASVRASVRTSCIIMCFHVMYTSICVCCVHVCIVCVCEKECACVCVWVCEEVYVHYAFMHVGRI